MQWWCAAVPSVVQLLLLRAQLQGFHACLCSGGGSFPPGGCLPRTSLLCRRSRCRRPFGRRHCTSPSAHVCHPAAVDSIKPWRQPHCSGAAATAGDGPSALTE